ncbi:hypothetical protein ABZV67_45245 [Streptomyces sp. NPDC005065]|uniref:hypothetical protein n=1 Tax=Streptomyces sp. NPDC005065 TaxID=3154461 RepID=UPI0033BA306C
MRRALEDLDAVGGKDGVERLGVAAVAVAQQVLRGGYQVAVHAISDLGNRVVLDAYERGYRTLGHQGLRHRIEHAQIIARCRPRTA